jgi:hypothetical protein
MRDEHHCTVYLCAITILPREIPVTSVVLTVEAPPAQTGQFWRSSAWFSLFQNDHMGFLPDSQKPISASPAVQNYLSVCADLIVHMQKGGRLTQLDFGLLIGTTTSMELLLRDWERQQLIGQ